MGHTVHPAARRHAPAWCVASLVAVTVLVACGGASSPPAASWAPSATRQPSLAASGTEAAPPEPSATPSPSPSNEALDVVSVVRGDIAIDVPVGWALKTYGSMLSAIGPNGESLSITVRPDDAGTVEEWIDSHPADLFPKGARLRSNDPSSACGMASRRLTFDSGSAGTSVGRTEVFVHAGRAYELAWLSGPGLGRVDVATLDALMERCAIVSSLPIPTAREIESTARLPLRLPAGVSVAVVEFSFPVTGATTVAVERVITARNASRNIDRHEYAPWTWTVYWNFETRLKSGTCRMRNIDVSVIVTIENPEWTDIATSAPGEADQWQAFLAAARIHQTRHTQNALDRAAEIRTALERLASQPTCKSLEKRANEQAEAISAAGRDWDRGYDARTGQGAVQGVVLP